MENPEEVLQSLDEFAKMKPKDIPRELEDYLSYVAKTGDPVYQWSIVKCLFREKLLNVITDFYETSPTIDLPPCPNVDPFNYETMKNSLLERLDSFPSAPFTVQRLCELLTTPRKEYSRADKFMRAIEKNILVVSTREPGNVRRSDNGQPELLMNGVMDGRGIELGEAIETVSSDGVNLMHSEENEVNVTENDSVPVECASMEEIDMEEQSDHIEPTNSNAWEKESDTSAQSEENVPSKNYNDNIDEDKPKESSESLHDGNADDTGENSNEPEEAPASTENVVDSFSTAIPEDPQVELDSCSSSSKDLLENNEEKCDEKLECVDSETSLQSEESTVSTMEDKDVKPANEETPESVTPDESESADTEESPIDKNETPEDDSVNITSVNDDLPAISSTSETNLAEEDANEESTEENTNSDTNLVVDGCSSSESVIAAADSPEEVISKSDSINTEISTEQLSEKSEEIDSADSKTTEVETLEVANVNAEEFVSSEVPPVESSDKNSEEKVSDDDPPPEAVPCADAVESGCDSTKEHETEQTTVTKEIVCQQEEAMEVDEVSSQEISSDVDEPMDQSEQLTEGQLER